MKISIFGTGYVGLVTGTCLADLGHQVACVDIDKDKIEKLSNGVIDIFEPGLEELVLKNLDDNNLKFTSDARKAIIDAEIIFIAVGTPQNEDGSANLEYVKSVAKEIGIHLNSPKLIVNKSTSPVGTTDLIYNEIINQSDSNFKFVVCSNPEFLREGSAIWDFNNGPRIIIGTSSNWAKEVLKTCYEKILDRGTELIIMSEKSAELAKYAANAMLATKISFINELANIAELYQADIHDIKHGIGTDPRIGPHFLDAGCGYGGSCFPKDVRALSAMSRDFNYDPILIEAVNRVNENQKKSLFRKLKEAFSGDIKSKVVTVWGLSFKPNTDDIREAPSIIFVEEAIQQGCILHVYDPEGMPNFKKLFPQSSLIKYFDSKEDALINSDALVICTEWKEFKSSKDIIGNLMPNGILIDGRNIFSKEDINSLNIKYFGIGINGN